MKSVLIVDDHPVVRAAVKIVLVQEGFKQIYEAACGNEVLPKIREHKPELVILDLVMPGMNGWDFFEEMRQRQEFGSVPVIIYTSAPARAPRGATRVLQKPMTFERLLSTVREYCPA